MNKHVFGLAAIPLIAAGVSNVLVGSVSAVTQNIVEDREACYMEYEGTSIPQEIPIGCIVAFHSEATTITADDPSILEVSGSADDGYTLIAKKVGEATLHSSYPMGVGALPIWVSEIKTNAPWIVNNNLKQYLLGAYGNIDEGSPYDYCGENHCIYVNLNISALDENTLSEDEKAKINETVGNDNIAAYGDITLTVETEGGDVIDNITMLGGCGSSAELGGGSICTENPITIKWGGLELGVPEEGFERNFYAVRVHDDEATKIAAEVDEDGNIVFPSGRFSTYAIAYEDVEVTEDELIANSKAGTPNTGAATKTDSEKIVLSLAGCIVAGIALALTMLPRIKKYLETRKA